MWYTNKAEVELLLEASFDVTILEEFQHADKYIIKDLFILLTASA